MRGTTSVLRVLLGLGLGSEHGEELVRPAHGRPFHLFDGFALVNRLLCSASRPESNTGAPTRSMWENCSTHFAATLSILQPTVVVSQGLSVSTWVQRTLFPSRWHGEHLYESLSDAGPVAVCLFSHPSARGAMGWGGRLDAPYLTSVVVPTLVRARHLS